MKLYQVMWLKIWLITWTLNLEELPPTKFGRAKTSQIWRDFSQLLTLTANISETDPHSENRKRT